MQRAKSITAGWMQMKRYKIAVLDDYQNVALESADWSVLRDRADIAVFHDHLAEPDAVIERLLPFDVVCVMRERTPLPRNVIERLPNLKLIASTGPVNASIDVAAAGDHGIAVVHTGYRSDPTIEFTWALILATARHIVTESNSVRSGGWQQTVGTDLRGKTLGVLGLGRIGSQVARIGSAFGMNLIAWSQNMTPEAAKAAGAILVSKDQLFERADVLTIHLVLSTRTRGLVGAAELERMKPTAWLINAARGPIVEEQALISVLKNKQIAGAAIDVFDIEPLPASHPFRTLDNVLATPHIGYVSHDLYNSFYEDTVSNIRKWLEGKVAVITGGTEGIGLATAKLFVKEGAYVFITGRRQKELDEAVKTIGSNVSGIQGDIAKLADLDRLYETVSDVKARIDVVFANAGVGEFVPFGAVTEEHFDKLFNINVRGTLFTVQKALPLLKDGGSIILNGSVASVKGTAAFGVYAASKAAIRSFVRTWTTDLKDRRIRSNVVSPGPINTPLASRQSADVIARIVSTVPMGRMGEPEEVAKVALFLASDDSSFVTGIELFVDGGRAQV